MKGTGLQLLRKEAEKKAAMKTEDFAELLDISPRTLAGWEDQDELPDIFCDRAWRKLAQLLLAPDLERLTLAAFKAVPSEWTSIWLVHDNEVVLFSEATRYFCLYDEDQCQWLAHRRRICPEDKHHDGFCVRSSHVQLKSLDEKSLVTWPLVKYQSLTLTRDQIPDHEWKRMPSRTNPYLYRNECYGLLHVPYVRDNAAVLLLSLENKLPFGEDIQKAFLGDPNCVKDEKLLERLREYFKQCPSDAPVDTRESALLESPVYDDTDEQKAKAVMEGEEFGQLEQLVRAFG